MINFTLFGREMKGSVKLLAVFAAVLTMYIACIIYLYDPETMEMLDGFTKAMPELMTAVGMTPGAASLLGFMISYLYGFIMLVIPMIFIIIRSISLVAKYVDRGSMVYLVSAPVKRSTIAITQALSLICGIFILVLYGTVVEIVFAQALFPDQIVISELLSLNLGLFALHIFIGSVCFLCSCAFSDLKLASGFGAGIPILMYIFQMLANMGGSVENFKYLTFFTLFDPEGLASNEPSALISALVLLVGSLILYAISVAVFSKKDLHI